MCGSRKCLLLPEACSTWHRSWQLSWGAPTRLCSFKAVVCPPVAQCYVLIYSSCPDSTCCWLPHLQITAVFFLSPALDPFHPQKPKGMWPCDWASSTSAGEEKKKKEEDYKVSKMLLLAEIHILFSFVGKAWSLSVLAPPAGNGFGSPVMDRFEESEKYKSHLFYS